MPFDLCDLIAGRPRRLQRSCGACNIDGTLREKEQQKTLPCFLSHFPEIPFNGYYTLVLIAKTAAHVFGYLTLAS
jgi:3-hydroxymyristoyl/3-hydroxydecanoyl-(acyl carrier protein) dehydratase